MRKVEGGKFEFCAAETNALIWLYVLAQNAEKDADAIPPVSIMASKAHVNGHREPRSGAIVYGWIEVLEPLDEATQRKYGLIEGDGIADR